MQLLPLAFAVSFLFAGTASARGFDACEFESDFNLRIAADALTFHRDNGTPAEVVMRHGRLILDGRSVALSSADRARVRQIENNVRTLVPEVKAIALDAIGVATSAGRRHWKRASRK